MLAYPVHACIQRVLSANCMPDSQALRTKCVILFPYHGVHNPGCMFEVNRVIRKVSHGSFVFGLALPSAPKAFPSGICVACSTSPGLVFVCLVVWLFLFFPVITLPGGSPWLPNIPVLFSLCFLADGHSIPECKCCDNRDFSFSLYFLLFSSVFSESRTVHGT